MEVGDHLKDIKAAGAHAAWSLVCHLEGLEQSFLLVWLCYDDLGKGVTGCICGVALEDNTDGSKF